MKEIINFISTKKFRKGFCFVLFTFLLTVIIASQNYFFQMIVENGHITKDIVAQHDIKVVDVVRTEQRKNEVAQTIEPILTRVDDDNIISSFDTMKLSILNIRKKDISINEKREELEVLFEGSSQKSFIDYLLRARTEDLNILFKNSKETLVSVLNKGVAAKDFYEGNIGSIIRKNISISTPMSQVSLITPLLEHVLVPNLVVDEFATEIAKTNAKNSVKSYEVVFKKGDKIAEKGDLVTTKFKRDVIRAAGYNILEVNFLGILGVFSLVAFFTFVFLKYEKNFEKEYYNEKYLTIMASFTLLISLIATMLPTGCPPYIVPIPAYTILLSIFTTPRNAFFASTILLALLTIGMHYSIEVVVTFALLNTVVMTSVSQLKFSKRSDLLLTSLKITLAGAFIVGGIYFVESYMMDIQNEMILKNIGFLVLNCFVIGGVFTLGVLPIIENTFRVLTQYGLAEWADHNQPLLKKLLSDAPGTFNHSLTVSHLAEAAAEAVGANPVLARVGTMYHDIGKLMRPMFFVENQSFYGIDNPHKSCAPRFSKMLITAHPKDGIELAKEYHLPQIIHSFILQHHGTGLVSYFYNEAVKQEGADKVSEEQFRYPGPKPNMKETGILMIADAVESAVRAAKNPTNEEIDAIIDKIIKERLNDGQLDDSPLTLGDLKVIAETFSKILRGMHHKRIKYHNDLVQELDKNNSHNGEEENSEIIAPALDKDLEAKLKELEDKRNENPM